MLESSYYGLIKKACCVNGLSETTLHNGLESKILKVRENLENLELDIFSIQTKHV